MTWYYVVLVIASIAIIVLALMQAHKGTASGLGALTGSDIELFQQQKDRGWSKIIFWLTVGVIIAFVLFATIMVIVYDGAWSPI